MKKDYPDYFEKKIFAEDLIKSLNKQDKVILSKYLKECRLTAGEGKVKQRERYVLQFRDIAELPYSKFNQDLIESVYLLIKESNRETAGRNEAIKNLKMFARFLLNDENAVKNLKAIPQKNGYNTQKLNHNTLASDEEVESLIRAGESLKERALLTLLAETGIRPCELLSIKWRDLKLDNNPATIKIFSPKTQETRVLPIKDCIVHLLRWKNEFSFKDRRDDDLIFPNKNRKQHVNQYLTMLFKRLCKNAEIRKLSPYSLRHKKLTELNKILPEKISAGYGGHSASVSARYTHLNSEEDIVDSVVKRVWNIKEPNIKNQKQLEKEIDNLKESYKVVFEKFNRSDKLYSQFIELLIKLNLKSISKEDFAEAIKNLDKEHKQIVKEMENA